MEKVLLLNAAYQPLRIIPWQRAVILRISGKVEVLQEYEREIRSVSLTLRLPSVVRLIRFFFYRPPAVKFSRINVYIRDQFRCQYCGHSYPDSDLSLDHVVPQWMGGQKCWENIVTCCIGCNRRKGGRTLDKSGMKLIRKPFKPRYSLRWGSSSQLNAHPETWRDYFHYWDPKAFHIGKENPLTFNFHEDLEAGSSHESVTQ